MAWISKSKFSLPSLVKIIAEVVHFRCRNQAETAKSNGADFYEYLKKLLMDLPNLDFHQSNDVLEEYMPWSKNIQEACGNK